MAFRLVDEAALIEAYRELKERDVPISFTVHHGITKSVYFTDPDGNQLEVYCDVARDERRRSQTNTWGWSGFDFAPDDPGLVDVIRKMMPAASQ